MSTWRERLAPIIAETIAEGRATGDDEKALRRRLRDAWPSQLGPRELLPYKTWLDEIKRQLGLKPPLGALTAKVAARKKAEAEEAARIRAEVEPCLPGCEA